LTRRSFRSFLQAKERKNQSNWTVRNRGSAPRPSGSISWPRRSHETCYRGLRLGSSRLRLSQVPNWFTSLTYAGGVTGLIRKVVAGTTRTAKVVTLDRPAARRFQHSVLGDEGVVLAESVEQFRAAVATPVDLLVVSTHGGLCEAKVGFGRSGENWVNIDSLSGRCSILLVIACNQERDRAAIWQARFSPTQVVLATKKVPGETADRAIGRVLDRPHTWGDGHAVLESLLDTVRPAPAMVDADWYVYPDQLAI